MLQAKALRSARLTGRPAPLLTIQRRRPLRPVQSLPDAAGATAKSTDGLAKLRAVVPNDDSGGTLAADVWVTPGSQTFLVSLPKPLGLVLTEHQGRIKVESVAANGSAAKAGIKAGDYLLAVTARAGAEPGRTALKDPLVLVATAGLGFNTVAAAIRSNTCSACRVHLVLERGA
ncbi:hypothetical protein HYH03_002510 [Edaphochlamys debaryana]|uniref:PDZ domain-containing protein n=1 Tax=Edaphochlamys debaryana TaxID=47281 RepID=A0A835YJ58_9CHLO|nr:hypothetical protein HYH03_002510 [Edaphochlamys debaryana]|eukprot:KAG2499565.1 hypothetical protein HYH03_002510 [Edaphochlamys debaryana]